VLGWATSFGEMRQAADLLDQVATLNMWTAIARDRTGAMI
jgi:hypothetical protein